MFSWIFEIMKSRMSNKLLHVSQKIFLFSAIYSQSKHRQLEIALCEKYYLFFCMRTRLEWRNVIHSRILKFHFWKPSGILQKNADRKFLFHTTLALIMWYLFHLFCINCEKICSSSVFILNAKFFVIYFFPQCATN